MADAVVDLLLNNLNSLVQREFGLIWGVDGDIHKLSSLLSTIQAVLQDAEMKQFADKSLANWLTKLNDTAYDTEDVLEEWLTETPEGTCALSCLKPNHIMFRSSIAKKLKKIIRRLDEVAEERLKFHLNPNVVTGFQSVDSRETSSFLTEEIVYGRDSDKENVVNALLSDASCAEELFVFSILGIGGIGKTTLAQMVYQDHRVVEQFGTRIWLCVSENFEVKRLSKMVVESLTGKTCDVNDLDLIQRQLQQNLSGKKFLLVLDDLWNEDPEKWQKFITLLKCGGKGSAVIITTRLETVTTVVGTPFPYRLTFLSEEECWLLFKRRAFPVGNEDNAELIQIGKQIVKKCGGVPLAAKALGGLLFSKRAVSDWLQVRDSEVWELPDAEVNNILPSLRLSYQYLPSRVKQCFAFCAIYPKDNEIGKEDLIQLWMANGLLQTDGRMELEDLGNQTFSVLMQRSFFQDIKIDDIGEIRTCKMHDLMHDLACSVSVNECHIVQVGKMDTLPKSIRYASLVLDMRVPLQSSNLQSNLQLLFKSNTGLRTLMFSYIMEFSFESSKILHYLRALDLSKTDLQALPVSIGKMKHLRYLNLSTTYISSLPESVCNLKKLQSLKLKACWRLRKLPKHMSKMGSLRHLDLGGCQSLTEMPIGMGQLIQLHTLSMFVIGLEIGRTIRELHPLNHLRGKLNITMLENVRNSEEAKSANLLTKKNISSLGLSWSRRGDEAEGNGDAELQERILEEGLQPNPSLKEMDINGYQGRIMPSWIAQLQNLVTVSLGYCERCENLPPLGKLALLKDLQIIGMSSVISIGSRFYGEGPVGVGGRGPWFPSVETLAIQSMSNLEEWSVPSSLLSEEEDVLRGFFPYLKTLWIVNCPKLKAFPCFPCVQELYLWSCNDMILGSLKNQHGLRDLHIYNSDELTCIPEGSFIKSSATLQSLEFLGCNRLLSILTDMETLTSLASLSISDCSELISISEVDGLLHKLTSLRELDISDCPSLKRLPVMGVQGFNNSLEMLSISNCANLTSLSEGLRYLTSLQTLHIFDCPKLELSRKEDFQHLISLRRFSLYKLPQLRALPEWMQHVAPTLQSLEITYCHPDLHKRCEKGKGEDWHIISHIPQLEISSPDIDEEPSTSVGNSSSSAVS